MPGSTADAPPGVPGHGRPDRLGCTRPGERAAYTWIVARNRALIATFALLCGLLRGQQPPAPKEEAPPEEDETLQPKREYAFNPLQAQKEIRTGGFYFTKGSYKAAAGRFEEATKWDPGSAEAFFRLGETEEKLRDTRAAREAWTRVLDLAPGDKRAKEVRKKLAAKD